MKFIRDLLAKKKAAPADLVQGREEATAEPLVTGFGTSEMPKTAKLVLQDGEETSPNPAGQDAAADAPVAETAKTASNDLLRKINAEFEDEAPAAETASVNIWDLDEDEAAAPAPEKQSKSRRRRRNNQTRLLGFNPDEDTAASPFETAETVTQTARTQFPVGWIVVADGPGRGESFALEAGMSQIGRGEDQAVQLDFGDTSVSRVNHAAIVYDQETHAFILGHGGKKNVVRLNGKPVISNEILSSHDEIKVGETTLRFMALCSTDFNWDSDESDVEEQEHVAIA